MTIKIFHRENILFYLKILRFLKLNKFRSDEYHQYVLMFLNLKKYIISENQLKNRNFTKFL